MEEMHAQHKDHKLFKHARLMTTVLKPAPKAIKDKTGKVLTENIEILGRWREYCSEMYKAEQTPDTTITDVETEPGPLIDEVRWALKQISNGKSPGHDEVRWALKQISNGKSPGHDEVRWALKQISNGKSPGHDEVRWALKQISNGKSPGHDEVRWTLKQISNGKSPGHDEVRWTLKQISNGKSPGNDEVRWTFKQISNGKSPGHDEVPIELIKEGGEESIQLYHRLILKIWKTRSWPKHGNNQSTSHFQTKGI